MEIEQGVYDMMYDIISTCNRMIDKEKYYAENVDTRILKNNYIERLAAMKELSVRIIMHIEKYLEYAKQDTKSFVVN